MKDIIALDGSQLNFVAPSPSPDMERMAAALGTEGVYLWQVYRPMHEKYSDLCYKLLNSITRGVFYIMRPLEDKYVGAVSYYLPKGQDVINVHVYIAPEERLNGYGRATILSLAHHFADYKVYGMQCGDEMVEDEVARAFCDSFSTSRPIKLGDLL